MGNLLNQEYKTQLSVVMPSYNHEEFILDALLSVAHQDFKDFELIIIDDASIDNSVEIINKFINAHQEIKTRFYIHEQNLGAVITLNELIRLACGEYIALINSDDIWQDGKLAQQVEILRKNKNIAAVFTQADIVDKNLNILSSSDLFFADVFYQKNRSRAEWLRDFFLHGNSLCHPSVMIRKQVYDDLGLYDPRFTQLPDFNFWIKLVKHYEIFIVQNAFVKLRWHGNNTSNPSIPVNNRNEFELFIIMSSFFDNMPDQLFIEAFSELFMNPKARSDQDLNFEKAFLFINYASFNNQGVYETIGKISLFKLLGTESNVKYGNEQFNFSYKELRELLGKNQIFSDSIWTGYGKKLYGRIRSITKNFPSLERWAKKILVSKKGE